MQRLAPRLSFDLALVFGSIAAYPCVLLFLRLTLHRFDGLSVLPGTSAMLRVVCPASLAVSLGACAVCYQSGCRARAICVMVTVLALYLVGIMMPAWGM